MFPLLFPLLLGAGGGALLNKKDPLKGALMGAALGTGIGSIGSAAMSGGLLGAAPAAASGAAALPGAAGAAGGALPSAAGQAAASTAATTVPQAEGLGGLLSGAEKYMKPVGNALSTVNAAQGLLGGQQQPMQAAPMQSRPGPDLSAWMSAEQQERANMGQLEAQRRLVQKQAIQGLLGGGYGGLA